MRYTSAVRKKSDPVSGTVSAPPRPVLSPQSSVVLAVAAGALDAACFTHLGQVFAGVMTGNLTLLGLAAADRSGTLAGHVAVALLCYAVGTALGSLVARRTPRTPGPTPVLAVLVLELTALAALTAGWILTRGAPSGAVQFGLLALATSAMGLQAAAVRSAGTKLSTTFLTGTLTTAIAALVTGGEPRADTRWSVAVLAAHAGGAAAAGGLLLISPAALPVLPDAALLGVVVSLIARRRTPQP
jgi:uncharacterized membrane protein YoaK (UPF0700 family)